MALGLTIDGQSFDIAGAWRHNRSLRRLRSTVVTRGGAEPMPYVDGRPSLPIRPDEIVVDLELMVTGSRSRLGVPYSDSLDGLDENLAWLNDFVLDHADGSTGTWPAVLETRSGSQFTAGVQILNWQILQENVTQVLMGYDLRIPSGRWTAVA